MGVPEQLLARISTMLHIDDWHTWSGYWYIRQIFMNQKNG